MTWCWHKWIVSNLGSILGYLFTGFVLLIVGTCASSLTCSAEDYRYSVTLWSGEQQECWNVSESSNPKDYAFRILTNGKRFGYKWWPQDQIDSVQVVLLPGQEYNFWKRDFPDSVIVRRVVRGN